MSSKERGTKLFGAMVIALKEGQRLGWVSEVFIDKEAKRIQGIAYRSGVFGMDQEIYVGFGDIMKFSRDFVIVSGQGEGRTVPPDITRLGLRTLRGCKITTHAGRHVATLADVIIDREDGKIVQIVLPENRVLQIDIAQVTFGPDLVMVPADYEPSVSPAEDQSNDFVDRFFRGGSLSYTVRESYEEIKHAMRNRLNPETVKKTWESSSSTARKTILRTSQAIQQGIEQIMGKRDTRAAAKNTGSAEQTAQADGETVMPLDATKAYTDPNQPDTIIELAPESVEESLAEAEPIGKVKAD